MSERRQAAWDEAQRRYPTGDRQAGFAAGAAWADDNPQPATGDTSDGHHTFDELYEYRMLYNAHAAHGWLAQGIPVVKSWRHADGEECFGGGWFIVTATLPAGQVSNHYAARHWGLFKVPEVDVPPDWDGHTPHDAAMRLRIEAEHAPGVERAEADEEPEVHVVECRGGCARVFDKPHPDPLFICRQCRLRMGQDV